MIIKPTGSNARGNIQFLKIIHLEITYNHMYKNGREKNAAKFMITCQVKRKA